MFDGLVLSIVCSSSIYSWLWSEINSIANIEPNVTLLNLSVSLIRSIEIIVLAIDRVGVMNK